MSTNFNYWSQVLENLRSKISGSNYQAWFNAIEFDALGSEGRKIVLMAPSEFHKSYIEKKFSGELRESINKFYPKVIHLEIKIKDHVKALPNQTQDPLDLKVAKDRSQKDISESSITQTESGNIQVASYLPRKNLNNLNPKYTFESLIVTKSNEFTVNLAKGVVNQLGTLYNPLFIYSSVGLGKTHLLQAIGHKVLEQDPTLNIKYVPSDTFFNQFYLALTKGEAGKFREYYESVDLLLIDDIQFIGGKEGFQNEFFHIFNLLTQSNKQIIFTSDRTPKDLIGVEERLVSRFEMGMITDIFKPDIDDRTAILRDKLERLGTTLSESHIQLIAQKVDTNIRELEGILNKIKAVMSSNPGEELSDRALLNILTPYIKGNVNIERTTVQVSTPDKVNAAVCRLYGISHEDLMGDSRRKDIAAARQMAFWFYKHDLKLSYPHIGRLVGGRDHSTVMHGCSKINVLLKQNDPDIISKINLCKEMLAQI